MCAAALDWWVIAIVFVLLLNVHHPVACVVWFLASVFIVGVWRHRLALLGHEAAHHLISRRTWLNDLLANVFVFWPNFLQASQYRSFHLRHHYDFDDYNDPELEHKKRGHLLWMLPLSMRELRQRVLFGMFGGLAHEAILIMEFIGPKTIKQISGPLLWWGIALSLLHWWKGWDAVFWISLVWITSTFTSFITIFHMRMLLEHHGTDYSGTHRIKATRLQKLLLLPHNTHCHYEHHEYPYIPFWRLEDARFEMILYAENPPKLKTVNQVFNSLGNPPCL